jgi:hypothetical protein
MKGER